MSNRVASLGVSLCLLACQAIAWGQSPEPPATAAAKIGVINMQGAIANTTEGKKALAELQKKSVGAWEARIAEVAGRLNCR